MIKLGDINFADVNFVICILFLALRVNIIWHACNPSIFPLTQFRTLLDKFSFHESPFTE